MSSRLSLAADAGALSAARVLLVAPPRDLDLTVLEAEHITILQDMMPDAAIWQRRDMTVVQDIPSDRFDLAIVFLPRAKASARDLIARAAAVSDRVMVDGQKTDGVESALKELRQLVTVEAVHSKSHGKLFWFAPTADLSDWMAHAAVIADRWHVVPGVFSADGVDPGSAVLAGALPQDLKGRIADLGAGWGYLAASVMDTCPAITELHLVEAQGAALGCAQHNVTDTRARFHWADATTWAGETGLDAIIMNPPFHKGRATDTDLGRAFITAAARLLRPGGTLWMVANRHLAYEQVLRDSFAEVAETDGDNRYKVIRAKVRARQKR